MKQTTTNSKKENSMEKQLIKKTKSGAVVEANMGIIFIDGIAQGVREITSTAKKQFPHGAWIAGNVILTQAEKDIADKQVAEFNSAIKNAEKQPADRDSDFIPANSRDKGYSEPATTDNIYF